MVGGVLVPEPGGVIPTWGMAAVARVARVFLPALFADANQTFRLLYDNPSPDFCVVRMGHMHEAPSKGVLRPEVTEGSKGQRGAASFVDVGAALLALADDGRNTKWRRHACYMNYGNA